MVVSRIITPVDRNRRVLWNLTLSYYYYYNIIIIIIVEFVYILTKKSSEDTLEAAVVMESAHLNLTNSVLPKTRLQLFKLWIVLSTG